MATITSPTSLTPIASPNSIANQRLYQQRLTQNQFATPEEIVAWMGAVQAQDYLGTKWALGLRMQDGTDNALEEAFNAGRILRTHVMRPTWHFVTPADIRWLVELTGPRINALCETYYRQLGLDEATMLRSNDIIAKQLEGGRFLTRTELGMALKAAGIAVDGLRLGFLMGRAEYDAVICSGPRVGKQFTYALLDERAPQAKRLSREEALAELTRRYFTSHGPATLRDFAWWSGLTLSDAKAGVAMVGKQLTTAKMNGEQYWFAPSLPDAVPTDAAFLLPTFDEFLVGFSAFDQARHNGQQLEFESTIVSNGEVIGSWKRSFKREHVLIELAPFAPLPEAQRMAVQAAAQRYGQFVGMGVESVYLN